MMNRTMKPSRHSMDRFEERFKSHNESRVRTQLVTLALRGIPSDRYFGREQAWIQERIEPGFAYQVSGDKFIVLDSSNGTIVTVYTVPQWFSHKPQYNGKEQIRNIRRYLRNNPREDDET